MFKESLLIDVSAALHPGAEEDGALAMRLEIPAAALNAWLGELGWREELDSSAESPSLRLRALRSVHKAIELCGQCLLDPLEMQLAPWGGLMDFRAVAHAEGLAQAAAQAWADGLAPLPVLSLDLRKTFFAHWAPSEWPVRGAQAAQALGRGLAQLLPGPAIRVSNERFNADMLEHTLAAYEPQEILRKNSGSMRGFALLALAASAIARDEALQAAGGDAQIAQGPSRPIDLRHPEPLSALKDGALFFFQNPSWAHPRLALMPAQAAAGIEAKVPLARVFHFALFGKLLAACEPGAGEEWSLDANSFRRVAQPPARSTAPDYERPFPAFGLRLAGSSPRAELADPDAAWAQLSEKLRSRWGMEIEPAAAAADFSGAPSDEYEEASNIHQGVWQRHLAREARSEIQQAADSAPPAAWGPGSDAGAPRPARKPRSL